MRNVLLDYSGLSVCSELLSRIFLHTRQGVVRKSMRMFLTTKANDIVEGAVSSALGKAAGGISLGSL